MNPWRATLALGGGGARGIAHLGAIEELLKSGLEVERIVGVSIGSLAGALFAFEPDIERAQKRTLEYLQSAAFGRHQRLLFGAQHSPRDAEQKGGRVWSSYRRLASLWRANQLLYRAVRRHSFLPGFILESVVDHLVPDADIADARIPLSIVAVDLHSGEPVVFEKGPARLAVKASAALPGVFPPVPFEGRLLCDIGEFYSLPLGFARAHAPETLVAVDVGANLKPLPASASALEILVRMNDIGSAMFRKHLGNAPDLLVLPQVADIPWFDFTAGAELVEAGRSAAREALAALPPQRHWIERLVGKALTPILRPAAMW